jgi:hypothetical protein
MNVSSIATCDYLERISYDPADGLPSNASERGGLALAKEGGEVLG